MGCSQSVATQTDAEARRKNRDFDNQLASQAKQEDEKIKLLLLGKYILIVISSFS